MKKTLQLLLIGFMLIATVHAAPPAHEDPTPKLHALSDYLGELYAKSGDAPLGFETWYNLYDLMAEDALKAPEFRHRLVNLFNYLHKQGINVVFDLKSRDKKKTVRVLANPPVDQNQNANTELMSFNKLEIYTELGIRFDSNPKATTGYGPSAMAYIPIESPVDLGCYFMIPTSAVLQQPVSKISVPPAGEFEPTFSPEFLEVTKALEGFKIAQHKKPATLHPSVKSEVRAKIIDRAKGTEKTGDVIGKNKSKEREKRKLK